MPLADRQVISLVYLSAELRAEHADRGYPYGTNFSSNGRVTGRGVPARRDSGHGPEQGKEPPAI